jgi:hypothetical protein
MTFKQVVYIYPATNSNPSKDLNLQLHHHQNLKFHPKQTTVHLGLSWAVLNLYKPLYCETSAQQMGE